MIFMFNKKTLAGHWFDENNLENDAENYMDYTGEAPPDTAHEWNEELNKWVLRERKQLEET